MPLIKVFQLFYTFGNKKSYLNFCELHVIKLEKRILKLQIWKQVQSSECVCSNGSTKMLLTMGNAVKIEYIFGNNNLQEVLFEFL